MTFYVFRREAVSKDIREWAIIRSLVVVVLLIVII